MKIIGVDIDRDGTLICSNKKVFKNKTNIKQTYITFINYIASNNIDYIAIEDFKNVKSKFKLLNKNLIGISKLIRTSEIIGNKVIPVKPNGTSQTCCKCNYKSKKSRKSKVFFKCVSCNFSINADLNAAKNIRIRGKKIIG